ncbi:MAG: hypothetical protein K0S30_2143 [Clostridia bacterium]|jgi:hypothetical protein|nr:hypothetical protein [Clostridia bacterium]
MATLSTSATRVVKANSICYNNIDNTPIQPTKYQFCRLTSQSTKTDGKNIESRGMTNDT